MCIDRWHQIHLIIYRIFVLLPHHFIQLAFLPLLTKEYAPPPALVDIRVAPNHRHHQYRVQLALTYDRIIICLLLSSLVRNFFPCFLLDNVYPISNLVMIIKSYLILYLILILYEMTWASIHLRKQIIH